MPKLTVDECRAIALQKAAEIKANVLTKEDVAKWIYDWMQIDPEAAWSLADYCPSEQWQYDRDA